MIYSIVEKIWNIPVSYEMSGRASQSDLFSILAEYDAMYKFADLVCRFGKDLTKIEEYLTPLKNSFYYLRKFVNFTLFIVLVYS